MPLMIINADAVVRCYKWHTWKLFRIVVYHHSLILDNGTILEGEV